MPEQIDVTTLLDITSERVRANSQDGNLLPSVALPEAVNEVRLFLSTAQSGEPLPAAIRDMSSIQLLQILFEIQKHFTQD